MKGFAPSKPTADTERWIAIRALRSLTGATLIDCAKALTECRGDQMRAVEWLRSRMLIR